MDLSYSILNKGGSFDDCDEFKLEQVDGGDWKITVDGEEVYKGEFAPFEVTVQD